MPPVMLTSSTSENTRTAEYSCHGNVGSVNFYSLRPLTMFNKLMLALYSLNFCISYSAIYITVGSALALDKHYFWLIFTNVKAHNYLFIPDF